MVVTLSLQREFLFCALLEVCTLLTGKWETRSRASSSLLAALQILRPNYLAHFRVHSKSQGPCLG